MRRVLEKFGSLGVVLDAAETVSATGNRIGRGNGMSLAGMLGPGALVATRGVAR
jgi:hypothetical protein